MQFVITALMLVSLVDGVWFSNDAPTALEPVTIYAALRNDGESVLESKVIFSIDKEDLPAVNVAVPSKGLVRVEYPYAFPSCKHTVSAHIEGEETSLGTRTIHVSVKPPESIVDYVEAAGQTILDTINPVATGVEQRLEKTRDTLAGLKRDSNSKKGTPISEFVEKSKEIASKEGVPLWRRGLAFVLGSLVIPVHYWMWALGLFLIFVIFRMLKD